MTSANRAGIIALVVALLVSAVAVYWFIDDGSAKAELAQLQSKPGREDLSAAIKQRHADIEALSKKRDEMRTMSEFHLAKPYSVPPDDRQPGNYVQRRFIAVRDQLQKRAEAKRTTFDLNEGLGLRVLGETPSDAKAPILLKQLQLAEKAVGIALSEQSPMAIQSFKIEHGEPVKTGPASRPALLTEFPLTLTVRGPLPAILFILHSASAVDGDDDFPLIVRGFSITSDNTTAKDDIQQLNAVFELAAMDFVPDAERGEARGVVAGAAAASSTRSAAGARP